MEIKYFEPLKDAWNQMIKALFKPFNIEKWFAIGFTAFLASLFSGSPSFNFQNNNYFKQENNSFEVEAFAEKITDLFNRSLDWMLAHPVIFSLILFLVVIAIAVVIILLWLSARGEFMFLDNVVHERAEVKKPWYQFKSLAFSLFKWKLAFNAIVFLVSISFATLMVWWFFTSLINNSFDGVAIILFIFSIFLFVLFMLVVGFVNVLLKNFVVPIMYKYNLSAVQAWTKFILLFKTLYGKFILFFLVMAVINVLLIIAIFNIAFFTCCIGLFILMIPYLNTVILLPMHYTLRAYSLHFMTQFGDEYNLFPTLKDESNTI